ncbi:hypothetical protein DL98DRAFT_659563 [Cadophora sp. DSE1049]|nr:hypothetical protein DL98DRAFT_659563 [Cadophora sp. DSE1049]
MDDLPTEILERILSFVPNGRPLEDDKTANPNSNLVHGNIQGHQENDQRAETEGEPVKESGEHQDLESRHTSRTSVSRKRPKVNHKPYKSVKSQNATLTTTLPKSARRSPRTNLLETLTFRRIILKSTDLAEFSSIVRGNRAAAVVWIKYQVVLPSYSRRDYARFETEKDEAANNAAFSEAIHGLFGILKSWEEEAKNNRKLADDLNIANVESPTDSGMWLSSKDAEGDKLKPRKYRRIAGERFAHSYIELHNPNDLPEHTCISKFAAESNWRNLAPSAATSILTKLDGIKEIHLYLSDNEKKCPQKRRQLRHDFALGLRQISLTSLTNFSLNYTYYTPLNHYFSPPTAYHDSSPSIDLLGEALHLVSLAPNLIRFNLSGHFVISPEVFWPRNLDFNKPLWSKLKEYHVTYSPCNPNGGWYFTRRPGLTQADDVTFSREDVSPEDSETESELGDSPGQDNRSDQSADEQSDGSTSSTEFTHEIYYPIRERIDRGDIPERGFRGWPNNEAIMPLMKAVAKAVKFMPVLKSMSLTGAVEDAYNSHKYFGGLTFKFVANDAESW